MAYVGLDGAAALDQAGVGEHVEDALVGLDVERDRALDLVGRPGLLGLGLGDRRHELTALGVPRRELLLVVGDPQLMVVERSHGSVPCTLRSN